MARGSDELALLGPALRVLAGGESPEFSLSREPGRGGQVIGSYAAVPSLADPRALLPLDATSSALRTILRGHATGAGSPVARAAAHLLGLASRVRLARPLLRDRVAVVTTRDDLDGTPLHAFLGEALGRKDFVTGLRLAPGRPNSKPVVQVVAHDGSVLAYAKFGWDDLTRRLMRHEAAVLRDLAPLTRGTILQVPEVLCAGEWRGLEALVLAPLRGCGHAPRGLGAVPVEASLALARLRPTSLERFADSRYWQRSRCQIEQLAPFLSDPGRDIVVGARDAIEARWGDVHLPTGRSHGDWIPPNMLVHTDGRFSVWDWERSITDAPLGIDTAQYIVYVALRRRRPSLTPLGPAGSRGRQALSRQGLDPDNFTLLLMLTLLEAALWFGEARQAGRSDESDDRFVRALAEVLTGTDLGFVDAVPPRRVGSD